MLSKPEIRNVIIGVVYFTFVGWFFGINSTLVTSGAKAIVLAGSLVLIAALVAALVAAQWRWKDKVRPIVIVLIAVSIFAASLGATLVHIARREAPTSTIGTL